MMTTPHIKLSKDICTELQNFRQHRKSSNELQRKINIAQEKLSSGGFQDVYSTDESNIETEYNTLKDMYQTALSTSQKEQEYVKVFLIFTI
jgi:predicted patatin/cPLA2 family phospholipase